MPSGDPEISALAWGGVSGPWELLIPPAKSEDHYSNSLIKLSNFYFLCDKAVSLKRGLKNIASNLGEGRVYIV